jgi:hypothetical protein
MVGWWFATPVTTQAQQAGKIHRAGYLSNSLSAPLITISLKHSGKG